MKAKLARTVGRKDRGYVINTHAQDSHAGGTARFRTQL